MNKHTIIYEKTKEDILKAKAKLTDSQLLTEDEVRVLIEEIAQLPDEEIIPMATSEGESNLNIDELVAEFNGYADGLTSKLDEVLSIISEGRVPSADLRDELNNVIENLCDKYEMVKNVAEKELSKEEMPEDGSPVSAYYDAIKNSRVALVNEKIKEIENTLLHFVSVQSLIARYAVALEPLQKEAKALLGRIGDGDISDIDEITEEAAGPELFIKALDCENLNTDDGNDMLDNLIDNFSYPSYVIRGLLSKSYFIPDVSEIGKKSTDKIKNKQEISKTTEVDQTSKEENISDEKEEEVVDTHGGDFADKNEDEPEKEHTAFRKAIEEKSVALEDDKFGILSTEISSSETKKLSASIFSNDMRKGNVKALKSIIQHLSSFNVLSPEVLKLRFNMPEDVAKLNLAFLQKKGYIRKYKIIPGGEFYCSSPRLEKSLTYKEAAKFVGVRQLHADTMGELIEDKASSASARISLLKLYTNTALNHIGAEIKRCPFCNVVNAESFIYRTYDSSNTDNVELLVGAFWTNYDEADDFSESLKELLDESQNINLFVFAAANKETAKMILDEIIKLAPDKLKDNIYLYAADEEKYYSYKDNAEISAEDIWKYMKKDDEENDSVEIEETGDSGAVDPVVREVGNQICEELNCWRDSL